MFNVKFNFKPAMREVMKIYIDPDPDLTLGKKNMDLNPN